MDRRAVEKSLKDRIEKALIDLNLTNCEGLPSKVNVFTGIIPDKKLLIENKITEFPFVALRANKFKHGRAVKSPIQDFKIIIGIKVRGDKQNSDFEDYQNGHHDLCSILEKIELDLLGDTRLDKGTIKEDIEGEVFLEQPYPIMYAQLRVSVMVENIDSIIGINDFYD